MSIFGYNESDSDSYDSREPNETEKELSSCCDKEVKDGICADCGQDLKAYRNNFSKCCGQQMVDGVCPECLRTALDYRYEQKVKEFNKYMGDFNNRLKRIKTIKE